MFHTHKEDEKYALHIRHIYFALVYALISHSVRAFIFRRYLLRYPLVHKPGLVHAM